MNIKRTLTAVGLLVLIAATMAAAVKRIPPEDAAAQNIHPGGSAKVMAIESYVKLHISELSPVKESLGGTFYVTDIQANEGVGDVHYEDGHNAYVADFTYSMSDREGIDIHSFAVRE